MLPYITAIIFVIFILVIITLIILFLFYMNGWLCFENVPRVLCLQNNYEELESIPPTEVEDRFKVDSDDQGSHRDFDEVATTIAAEDYGRGEASRGDDDNHSDESDEFIKKFGTLVTKFTYEIMKNTLLIDIIAVQYLPVKRQGGPSMYQLAVKIFNADGQSLKKWQSPMFKVEKNKQTKIQQSKFHTEQMVEYTDLSQKDVSTTAVRFRLYGCERKRRDKLLSESIVGLANINLGQHKTFRIRLEKRGEIKLITTEEVEVEDENDYTTAAAKKIQVKIDDVVGDQMELLIGLAYNKVTGRLTVEIVKGNSLLNPLTREEKLPNAFVKMTLCASNCQVIAKSKTTARPNQANPLFKEKFIFQVPHIQLSDISIIIGVYHKKTVHRREIIGWFAVGLHSTGSEQKSHWTSMETANGEITYQWHVLQRDSISKHGLPGAD